MEQFAKELHKPAIRHFDRRRVKAFYVNQTWAVDLADMNELLPDNNGFRYVMTVIDLFTRYAWAVPLKNKDAKTVAEALSKLFEREHPDQLWSDQGKEFVNADVKKVLQQYNVRLYHTYSEHKASVIERFNRTLKTIMYRYFTEHQTHEWVSHLKEFLNEYNHSVHRSIALAPATAHFHNHDTELLERQQADDYQESTRPKFKVGDLVRTSRVKGHFEKGYHNNWTFEVFKVAQVLDTKPRTYRLKDYDNEPIEGSYYEEELQKTQVPDIYLVNQVKKTRKRQGKRDVFVSWEGWPAKFDSWIPEENIKDVHTRI